MIFLMIVTLCVSLVVPIVWFIAFENILMVTYTVYMVEIADTIDMSLGIFDDRYIQMTWTGNVDLWCDAAYGCKQWMNMNDGIRIPFPNITNCWRYFWETTCLHYAVHVIR
jgi:hypothetical protein